MWWLDNVVDDLLRQAILQAKIHKVQEMSNFLLKDFVANLQKVGHTCHSSGRRLLLFKDSPEPLKMERHSQAFWELHR